MSALASLSSGAGEVNRFAGLKVLAVEDEPVLLMALEDMLADLGCVVAATAVNIEEALAAIDGSGLEVAILDVQLGKDNIDCVALAASAAGVPVIFATGHGAPEIARRFGSGAGLLQKPYTPAALAAALTAALNRACA